MTPNDRFALELGRAIVRALIAETQLEAALARIEELGEKLESTEMLAEDNKKASKAGAGMGDQEVTVFATGEAGDVHNKLPQPNNGEAGVFFPADFSGSAHIEVRDVDGNVISEGDITV